MQLAPIINQFLRHCERQGLRPNTLRAYRSKLESLRESLGDSEPNRPQLLDWLHQQTHWADGDPKTNSTQAAYRATLAILLNFAVAEELLPASPLKPQDLKRPLIPHRERIATTEETLAILAHAPQEFGLLYRCLRMTGARPDELTAARIEWISDTAGGRVLTIINNKTSRHTGKARIIPIGEQVEPLFTQAIGRRHYGPIFLTGKSRPWTVAHASRIFRETRDALGISPELVLYSARHEFGSQVTKEKGIHAAMELLGHSSISVTQRYAHLTTDELAQIQSAAVPDITPATDVPGSPSGPTAA